MNTPTYKMILLFIAAVAMLAVFGTQATGGAYSAYSTYTTSTTVRSDDLVQMAYLKSALEAIDRATAAAELGDQYGTLDELNKAAKYLPDKHPASGAVDAAIRAVKAGKRETALANLGKARRLIAAAYNSLLNSYRRTAPATTVYYADSSVVYLPYSIYGYRRLNHLRHRRHHGISRGRIGQRAPARARAGHRTHTRLQTDSGRTRPSASRATRSTTRTTVRSSTRSASRTASRSAVRFPRKSVLNSRSLETLRTSRTTLRRTRIGRSTGISIRFGSRGTLRVRTSFRRGSPSHGTRQGSTRSRSSGRQGRTSSRRGR